jgi:hypothetical protein
MRVRRGLVNVNERERSGREQKRAPAKKLGVLESSSHDLGVGSERRRRKGVCFRLVEGVGVGSMLVTN